MPARDTNLRNRSSAELVAAALSEHDEDARWEIVVEVQRRGSRKEFELARSLFDGGDEEQRLACNILGQLGFSDRELGAYPWAEETTPLVERGLRSSSTAVQAAAITAAGHLRLETLMPDVITLASSSSGDVRYSVAFALGGRADDASVRALVALMSDPDDDVRNWATFGIGTQCDRSDALICDALALRIADEHDETRGEAWVGLARRADLRAFESVRRSLESEVLSPLAIQAAEAYSSPTFVPALEGWLHQCQGPEDEHFKELLHEAIAACRAGAS